MLQPSKTGGVGGGINCMIEVELKCGKHEPSGCLYCTETCPRTINTSPASHLLTPTSSGWRQYHFELRSSRERTAKLRLPLSSGSFSAFGPFSWPLFSLNLHFRKGRLFRAALVFVFVWAVRRWALVGGMCNILLCFHMVLSFMHLYSIFHLRLPLSIPLKKN